MLQALGRAGKFEHYQKPIPPLLVIALASLGLLIAVHGLKFKRFYPPSPADKRLLNPSLLMGEGFGVGVNRRKSALS